MLQRYASKRGINVAAFQAIYLVLYRLIKPTDIAIIMKTNSFIL